MPVDKRTVEEVWAEVAKTNAYIHLGLLRNPFPASGGPPTSPGIQPYPEVYEQITKFFKAFIRSRQSRGMVLLGDYGTGKTYHLRWIKGLLEARSDQVNIRVVSIETPGLEPYDLVRGILTQIGDQEIAKAVWALLLPEIRAQIQSEGLAFFKQFAVGKVKPKRGRQIPLDGTVFDVTFGIRLSEETLVDHREFLSAFDKSGVLSRERLRDKFLPSLYGRQPDGGRPITDNIAVARELANLCFFAGAPALSSWERLTVPATRKSPFPPRGEPEFLQAILRLLIATRTEYFVLLLDEFEKVPLMEIMTQRETKRYLDTVRMLVDRGWQEEDLPFAWVIASHDEAWDLIRGERALNQALAQRFLVEVHLPRTYDLDVARYLVSRYLTLARLKEQPPDSLSPFPPNFLELIPPPLRHTPRVLLTMCYDLVEEASEADLDKEEIPEAFVTKFLERHRLPFEEASDSSDESH